MLGNLQSSIWPCEEPLIHSPLQLRIANTIPAPLTCADDCQSISTRDGFHEEVRYMSVCENVSYSWRKGIPQCCPFFFNCSNRGFSTMAVAHRKPATASLALTAFR